MPRIQAHGPTVTIGVERRFLAVHIGLSRQRLIGTLLKLGERGCAKRLSDSFFCLFRELSGHDTFALRLL